MTSFRRAIQADQQGDDSEKRKPRLRAGFVAGPSSEPQAVARTPDNGRAVGPSTVLHLQRTIGNHAVQHLLQRMNEPGGEDDDETYAKSFLYGSDNEGNIDGAGDGEKDSFDALGSNYDDSDPAANDNNNNDNNVDNDNNNNAPDRSPGRWNGRCHPAASAGRLL